nr:hypothetical protein [Paenibacillus elgii]
MERPDRHVRFLETGGGFRAQPIAVRLKMEQALKHRAPVFARQRQKLRELPLRQHDRPGKIGHRQAQNILNLLIDLARLVSQHDRLVVPVLNQPAQAAEHRDVAAPLELAVDAVALDAERMPQLEGKRDGQRLLRLVHNRLRAARRPFHLPEQGQRHRIEQRRLAAARRPENAEDACTRQRAEINILRFPVALQPRDLQMNRPHERAPFTSTLLISGYTAG